MTIPRRPKMLAAVAAMAGLSLVGGAIAAAEPSLTYRGQWQLASGATFEETVIGGLSAISYDAARDLFYVVSDDRSATGPARFYTMRLLLSDNGIEDVVVTGSYPLLDESGNPFAPLSLAASPPVIPPDPEGIAFDPIRQRLYWSSEGERITDAGPVLGNPWIRIAALDGSYLGDFEMPPGLGMSAQPTGPRRNKALEGLTLTPDAGLLFAAMEAPGYDDGDPPDHEHGALTRITAFDVDAGAPLAQYAYPLDPVPATARSNGLSDLVALSATTFLVLERAGAIPPVVRLYRAEIGAATDVLGVASLPAQPVIPMTKTLLTDLSAAGGPDPLDNVEGITLGPALPDGAQSVVLVSDDNFSAGQVTQFLLFAG